ncbi:MAG: ATP-binding protein [Gemmatimonadaceae bacterium]
MPPNDPATDSHRALPLLRLAEERLRQTEKLAQLGMLTAGVAHDLNNPAAAAARGATELRHAFARLQTAVIPLTQLQLTPERAAALFALAREDRERIARIAMIDPLMRSDMDTAVEEWLDMRQIAPAWELAPGLVSLGYQVPELEQVAHEWGDATGAVLGWIARAQAMVALTREIEESVRRISEIVQALKTYSFLGQGIAHSVDVTDGIESTLVVLRNKLKGGVRIVREFADDLPHVEAYGGELNQVWTNLIDNAADAMQGKGTLTLRARHDGDAVVVEIEDDGPGMPEEVQRNIFTPFFTTKDPGKGTGLGLHISRNVVVDKHAGTIDVASRPGSTRFRIRLPIHLATPAAADATSDGDRSS